MGRVRTKTVKKAARVIIEKYYTKLTLDFDTNKRIIEEVALIPSKPLRNKVSLYHGTLASTKLHDDKHSYTNLNDFIDYKKNGQLNQPTNQLNLTY